MIKCITPLTRHAYSLASNLIVLHGWGQSKINWSEFSKRFNDLDVILVDLPGFGQEPLISPRWGISDYARWVEEKLIANISAEYILMGHSFGGRVASNIASKQPALLRGLILYGAPCVYRPSLNSRLKILLAKILKKSGVKYQLIANRDLQLADTNGLGRIFRNVVNDDQTSTLPQIRVPTQLIWGQNDKEVPLKIAYTIKNLVPNSSLTIIEHAGHNAHIQKPYLFYGTVRNFIHNN